MCAHHFILIVTPLLLLSGGVCEFLRSVCVRACSYVYFNVGPQFLSSLSVLLLYYYCTDMWAMSPDVNKMNE